MNKRVMAGLMASLLVFEACPTTSWAGVLAEGSQEMTPAATIMANLENENAELVASEKETVEAVVEENPEATPAPEATAEPVEEEKVDEPVAEVAAETAPAEEAPAEVVETEPQAEGDFVVEFAGTSQACDSLQEAFTIAQDAYPAQVTIKVTKDVTLNEPARCTGSNVNILLTSDGDIRRTITRGDIKAVQDNARSTYNPAMIEIDGSLRVENLVLDDAKLTAGSRYSQATTDGKGGNGDTVQDAIIATYDGGDSIVLGHDSILKDFGGMSAVRLSGGTLTMESGSQIFRSKEFTTKGGGNGAAGAIWIQGGTTTVSEGATIAEVNGRGIYVDGGQVTVNGLISNITGNNNMWQGQSGAAIHVRNGASAVLGSTGCIDTITGNGGGYTGAVMTNGSRGSGLNDFEAKAGSVIRSVSGFPTVYSNYGTELLNGTITGCSYDFIIGGFAQKTTIGKDGVIENCTAPTTGGAAYAVVYTNNASKIYHYGTVRNNKCSHAFYIINQSGGGASLEMYEGASIANNSGEGVYINASECSMRMYGGTIEGNGSRGVYVREKSDRTANFVMDNGRIANNGSYGVYYSTNAVGNRPSSVQLNGGVITGHTGADYYVAGSNACDNAGHIAFVPSVIQESSKVSTSFGKIDLGSLQTNVMVGNAKSAATTSFKGLIDKFEAVADSPSYQAVGSTLWVRPSSSTLSFTMDRSNSVNANKNLWAAYVPLKADGTVKDEVSEPTLVKLDNKATLNVTLDGLEANQAYAVLLVQPYDGNGSIKLSTTDEITEVLDQAEDYSVDFHLDYDLKNNWNKVNNGDVIDVTVDLDSDLTPDLKKLVFSTRAAGALELVEAPTCTGNAINAKVKVVDASKIKSYNSRFTITVPATFKPEVFDTQKAELHSSASVSVPTTIDGAEQAVAKTDLDAITNLVPLSKYTVTFDVADGSMPEGFNKEVVVKEGKVIDNPGEPTRFGHEFVEWQSNGATHDFTQPVTGDLTINARWNPLVFTVTYQYEGTVPEGASTLPEPQRVAFGETYTVAPNATAPGYTFSGWTLSGDQVMGASDVVLTGSFIANPVTPEPEPENPTPPANPGDGAGGGTSAPTPTPNPAPGAGTTIPAAPAAPAATVAPATGGVAPAAPTTVEDDATPLAEAAEETAASEAVAETISDDGTPLARTPESRYFPYWIWVLGAALTAVYGFLVARNRKNDDANDTASA